MALDLADRPLGLMPGYQDDPRRTEATMSGGHYRTGDVAQRDADGYIHLSTAEQLETTIAKYFAGQVGLMIAEVDLVQLGDKVRWEPARGGDLFPHIYAELPIHAVVSLRKRD